MIKLSRTGWNNVIIFAVMGFILLINATQKHTFKDDAKVQGNEVTLIAEHSIILSLTVNQQTNIERIGQTWRALPGVIQGQPLEAMMSAWHHVSGQLIPKPKSIDKSQSVIVSLVLAGQDKDEYFMLVPNEQGLVVFKQSTEEWLLLASPIFSQLIPNEVIM